MKIALYIEDGLEQMAFASWFTSRGRCGRFAMSQNSRVGRRGIWDSPEIGERFQRAQRASFTSKPLDSCDGQVLKSQLLYQLSYTPESLIP